MKYRIYINKYHKGIIVFIACIMFICVFSACSGISEVNLPVVDDYEYDEVTEIVNLKVGVVSGPYGDMFKEAILPSLEEMGYSASFSYYNDYSSPNVALAQNEIDLNIFQHYTYLNSFKFEHNLALTAIMEIPTVSMGVFSNSIKSLDDIKNGITVSVPDDSSNLARALWVLESANVISLDPFIDKSKAVVSDIISNPYNMRIIPMKAHELVQSLDVFDVSVVNGNYAISGGLYLPDALYQEVLVENYINVIAVRTDDLTKQFVRDIIDIIYSNEFCDVVTDPEGKYVGFQWPRWLSDVVSDTGGKH